MTKDEIISWLKQYDNYYSRNEYTINDDIYVDVKGNVYISYKNLTKIPIKFNIVDGDFDCSYSKLTSLENCPHTVNGNFDCLNNQLTSLEHCPHTVNGYFDCSCNKLTSLEHCPQIINGSFDCHYNQLTSLKGIGYVKGNLICDYHLKESKEYQCYLMMKQLEK